MPIILLGIRSYYEEDTQATVVKMFYVSYLRFSGEFFRDVASKIQQLNFLLLLKEPMKKLSPVAMSKHTIQNVFVYKDFNNC